MFFQFVLLFSLCNLLIADEFSHRGAQRGEKFADLFPKADYLFDKGDFVSEEDSIFEEEDISENATSEENDSSKEGDVSEEQEDSPFLKGPKFWILISFCILVVIILVAAYCGIYIFKSRRPSYTRQTNMGNFSDANDTQRENESNFSSDRNRLVFVDHDQNQNTEFSNRHFGEGVTSQTSVRQTDFSFSQDVAVDDVRPVTPPPSYEVAMLSPSALLHQLEEKYFSHGNATRRK